MGKIKPKKIEAKAAKEKVVASPIAEVHVFSNKLHPFTAPITLSGKVVDLDVNKVHRVNVGNLDMLSPTLQTLFTELNTDALPKYARYGYTQAHRQTFGLCLASAHSKSFKGIVMYHGVFAGQMRIAFNNTTQGLFATQAQKVLEGAKDVVVYPFKTYCFVAFKETALPVIVSTCKKVLGMAGNPKE